MSYQLLSLRGTSKHSRTPPRRTVWSNLVYSLYYWHDIRDLLVANKVFTTSIHERDTKAPEHSRIDQFEQMCTHFAVYYYRDQFHIWWRPVRWWWWTCTLWHWSPPALLRWSSYIPSCPLVRSATSGGCRTENDNWGYLTTKPSWNW